MKLETSDFQSQGFSPVCGCYEEQRPEDWRGIAFATRHLTIERRGRLPLTAFMLTVAAPRPITWISNGERFSADLYFINVPKSESFVPSKLLNSVASSTYRIIEKRRFEPKRYFMMFSGQGLNVDLLGDKPLAAWIPSDGARVTMAYSKGMFPSSKIDASIKEEYDIRFSESELQEIVGVPLGDFLGPNVVVWSEDSKMNIMAGKEIIAAPPSDDQSRIITALVANPPFSLRIACLPESDSAIPTYKEILASETVEESKQDYLSSIRHPLDESGIVEVVIPDIEKAATEFAEVHKNMRENDLVRIPNIPGDFIMMDYETNEKIGEAKTLGWMEFRYPPIPPNPGFNVFGSFKTIEFEQVKGKLRIGSNFFDIDVPSKLQLREISSLKVDGGVIQVPIRWDTKVNQADIQFEATAQASLNGETLDRGIEPYKQQIEYVLLASAVLSAIATVAQVVLARRALRLKSR